MLNAFRLRIISFKQKDQLPSYQKCGDLTFVGAQDPFLSFRNSYRGTLNRHQRTNTKVHAKYEVNISNGVPSPLH